MIDGADLSTFQGHDVDFCAMRASGIQWIYTRAMLKNGAGQLVLDDTFARNVAEAKAAGLFVGAYGWDVPSMRTAAGVDAAKRFWDLCGGLGAGAGELPPAIDFEIDGHLLGGALAKWLNDFASTLSDLAGRKCALYTGREFWRTRATNELAWAADHPLWEAQYTVDRPWHPTDTDHPGFIWPWPAATMWQYSGDHGAPVRGVAHPCDRDVFFGTIEDLRAFANMPDDAPAPIAA